MYRYGCGYYGQQYPQPGLSDKNYRCECYHAAHCYYRACFYENGHAEPLAVIFEVPAEMLIAQQPFVQLRVAAREAPYRQQQERRSGQERQESSRKSEPYGCLPSDFVQRLFHICPIEAQDTKNRREFCGKISIFAVAKKDNYVR